MKRLSGKDSDKLDYVYFECSIPLTLLQLSEKPPIKLEVMPILNP